MAYVEATEPQLGWSSSKGMDAALPDFKAPPVVEVALAVQFEPLTDLRTPQLGLLWQEFRDQFPRIEEHAPLDPVMERFGATRVRKPNVHIQMTGKPPVPRCWFLNEDGTELIQIQQDRFARNWRKVEGEEEYPRYKNIRADFERNLAVLEQFVANERLGGLRPNQCEVTYVNHFLAGSGWQNHGELGKTLTVFEAKYSEEFLPELEEGQVRGAYVIPGSDGQPLGRLRFATDAAYRRLDDQPILVLNLVARGRPDGEGMEGVMRFLDTGHEWIVRAFAALTTPEMHKIWGRRL